MMRKQKPQIALRQGTPAQAIPPRETIAVPAESMPHPNDFIEALSRKSAPAAPNPTAASPLVSARSLSERFGGNLGGLAKKAGMGVFMLIVYLGLMHLAPDAKMMSLIGGKTTGTNTEMNVSTLNAGGVAPEMESKVGSSGETTAAPPQTAPAAAPLAISDAVPAPAPKATAPFALATTAQAILAKLQALPAQWPGLIAALHAKFGAAPLWFMFTVIGLVTILPAIRVLNRLAARRAKTLGADPFERLLQRRLAEQAQMEKRAPTLQRA
jgi:hypothetical protein